MPADETYDTAHESTVKVGHREHCWNNRSRRSDYYMGQDGFVPMYLNGQLVHMPKFIAIEDYMSIPCGQRKGMAPPGCTDCKELGE